MPAMLKANQLFFESFASVQLSHKYDMVQVRVAAASCAWV